MSIHITNKRILQFSWYCSHLNLVTYCKPNLCESSCLHCVCVSVCVEIDSVLKHTFAKGYKIMFKIVLLQKKHILLPIFWSFGSIYLHKPLQGLRHRSVSIAWTCCCQASGWARCALRYFAVFPSDIVFNMVTLQPL